MYTNLARSEIRAPKFADWSDYRIIKELAYLEALLGEFSRPNQTILHVKAKNTTRSSSTRQIRQIIRYITKDFSGRRLLWRQVKLELKIKASAETIRRTLRLYNFRRCIACSQLFISKKQAKARL